MSKVTNLNQVRKARARDEKRVQADRNAVSFGRSKAQKAEAAAQAAKAARDLDGKKRT